MTKKIRKYRIFYFLIFVSVVFIMLSIIKQQGISYYNYEQVKNTLSNIKNLDIKLNESLLKIQGKLSYNYAPLVDNLQTLQKEKAYLKKINCPILGGSKCSYFAGKLDNLIKEKQEMIEQFKSNNTTVQRSLYALLIASDKLQKKKVSEDVFYTVELLVKETLVYYNNPNHNIQTEIVELSQKLKNKSSSFDKKINKTIKLVIKHSENILAYKKKLDKIGQSIIDLPTQKSIDSINTSYYNIFQTNVRQSQILGYIIFTIAGILAVVLLITLTKLRKKSESLLSFNETLKTNQNVLEINRTELEQALEENTGYLEQIEAQKSELLENNNVLKVTQEVLETQQKQLKITLAENQSIARALNESAVISITDLKGNILQVNEIFCEISGYTEQELLGNNQNIVNSSYHSEQFWKKMWRIIGTGGTWRGEIRNRAKDAKLYWVDAVINPMYDVNGKVYRYLSIRYLITKRKEAEEKIKVQNASILRKNRKIAKTIDAISRLFKDRSFLNGNWYPITQKSMRAGIDVLRVDVCQTWYYNYKDTKFHCFVQESKNEQIFPESISQAENSVFFDILEKEIHLKINDVQNDERLNKNDKNYFLDKGLKSFILYPILLSPKQKGIIAIGRKKVYNWETEDVIFIKSLNDEFNFAYQAFKKEQAKNRIKEQNTQITRIHENITESIAYAHSIQTAILPSPEEISQYLPKSFVYFKPRDVVSGDFYFFAQKEYKVIITAVDCTGHGIPGAFMSLIANNLLSEIVNAKAIIRPDKILNMLREGIIRVLKQEENSNQDGMDIAVCAVEHYPEEFYEEVGIPHLEYAGAGNPLIYFQNNQMYCIKPDKIIIGGFKNYVPEESFTLHRIPLDIPTTFYIFSDGIQDQFGGKENKKFTPNRLRNLLSKIHHKSMDVQQEILSQTIKVWQQDGKEEQVDDMLLIGVKV